MTVVEPDVCMGEEVVLEALQQKGSATGLTGEVRVVEECTHALAGQEVGLHGSQGGRDPEGEKGRHERVPLLAALGLEYAVGVVGSVLLHSQAGPFAGRVYTALPTCPSCASIQLLFVFSCSDDSAFHCLLMLPPAVVVPILTLSAITGPPAHALDSSAGEAFLWNGLLRAYAGKLEPQSLQMSCCAISTSSPVSTTTGELNLSPTGSRSGEESSSLSTPPLRPAAPPAEHGRRGPPHRSLKQGAHLPRAHACSELPLRCARHRGRSWSAEAVQFVRLLSRCRARSAPPHLRASSTAAWLQRWSGLLAL